jgi:D-alanyl-D-alanine carboxypeptidase
VFRVLRGMGVSDAQVDDAMQRLATVWRMRAGTGLLLLLCAACEPRPVIPATTCAASAAGFAPTAGPDDLCSVLEPIRQRHNVPSLAAAVWVADQLVAEGAVGIRKVGDRTPVTTSDRWHLGSDTKAMTATLAGLLVDAHLLTFDATLPALFPAQAVHSDYREVSLRQLLTHRSGTSPNPRSAIWRQMERDGRSMEARQSAVVQLLQEGPDAPRGDFLYSNSGYVIAGAALERTTSVSWEALLQERLFSPLAMSSCGFGAPATPGTVDQPWGHGGNQLDPVAPGPGADNPPAIGPAGTVHCSLADWLKFLVVHLRGARGEPTLVSADTLAALQAPVPTPQGGGYAMGWGVETRDWADGTVLTHSGSNTTFFATVWIAPAKNAIMVAVTNCGGDDAARATDDAFAPLVARYLGAD